MATRTSILAWEIPWTEKPDGLQSKGSQRVRHNGVTKQQQCSRYIQHLSLCIVLNYSYMFKCELFNALFLKNFFLIYLFLAVLGLRCCVGFL